MRYIAIKSMDRGGTNAFLSLFHYHPEFFGLTEKVHSRAGKTDIKNIHTNEIFNYSMFNGLDVNLKNNGNVKNIIFKMSRDTKIVNNVYSYEFYEHKYDKVIYLLRNPLRVYLSQEKANKESSRPKWDEWTSIVNQTSANIDMYKRSDRQNTTLVVYEYFIKNLNSELSNLLKWVDKDTKKIDISPEMGLKFWSHCGKCSSKFEQDKSKYLKCPRCNKIILGHGKFNPASPVKYERTVRDDLHASFANKPKMIKYIKQKFGKSLSNYWLNDADHNYSNLPDIS